MFLGLAFASSVISTLQSSFVRGSPSTLAFCPINTPAQHIHGRTRHHRAARHGSTPSMNIYDVEIEFHGEDYVIPVHEDQTLLEGIEGFGLTVPYSCRAGVCMTCAAKIVKGDVDLGEIAMMTDLKDDGYVLTCSGKPRGPGIVLKMEKFEEVYDKQYGRFEFESSKQ